MTARFRSKNTDRRLGSRAVALALLAVFASGAATRAQEPAVQPAEKPAAKPAEKSAEKPADKSTAKPAPREQQRPSRSPSAPSIR